jgi:arsenate reductase
MVLYHWARCSTCREARRQLSEQGIKAEERDIFAAPLSGAELEDLAGQAGGLRVLASTASPAFRARGLRLDEWSDPELRSAMLEDPRLLRRPILRHDGGAVLVGLPAITRVVTT